MPKRIEGNYQKGVIDIHRECVWKEKRKCTSECVFFQHENAHNGSMVTIHCSGSPVQLLVPHDGWKFERPKGK